MWLTVVRSSEREDKSLWINKDISRQTTLRNKRTRPEQNKPCLETILAVLAVSFVVSVLTVVTILSLLTILS